MPREPFRRIIPTGAVSTALRKLQDQVRRDRVQPAPGTRIISRPNATFVVPLKRPPLVEEGGGTTVPRWG